MANCLFCKKFEKCLYRIDREFSCRDYQMRPITNADLIRSMTDEELAEWLAKNDPECDPPEWWLDWLKQEADEGK